MYNISGEISAILILVSVFISIFASALFIEWIGERMKRESNEDIWRKYRK